MKKFTLTLLLLGSVLFSSYAQNWTPLNCPATSIIFDIQFVDANKGWVVGMNGIYYTADGGSTWTSQYSGSCDKICMINATTGYVLDGGDVLKTTDGGQTWNSSATGGQYLHGLHFCDANNGWAVGGSTGGIYHTTDGGTNWTQQTSPISNSLWDVWAIDANKAFIVGNQGTLLYTTNGGSTWTGITVSAGSAEQMYKLFFLNSTTGWIVSKSAKAYKTTDGGQTWTKMTETPAKMYFDVFFVNDNYGWISGQFGTFLRTTDGGQTWFQNDYSVTQPNLYGIWFIDNNNGFMATSDGEVLRTQNGGGAVGINELSGIKGLNIYITSNNELKINYNGNDEFKPTISLYDVSGKLVFSNQYSELSGSETIQLSDLSKGVYIIELVNQNNVYSKKLIL